MLKAKTTNQTINQTLPQQAISSKVRRHPNLLTAAERAQLPDPCRPIDTIITPSLPSSPPRYYPHWQTDIPNFSPNERVAGEIPPAYQFTNFADFIVAEQSFRQQQPLAPPLPLPLLNKLIAESGIALIEQVLTTHPSAYSNPLEAKLAIMSQLYPMLLCVFLLSQCKARKTLNQSLDFSKLSHAINHYIVVYQHTLKQLTPEYPLFIQPYHVQFAVLALGWQVSHHTNIADRFTTISSHNFLTKLP